MRKAKDELCGPWVEGRGQETPPQFCLPPSCVMVNGIKGLDWET